MRIIDKELYYHIGQQIKTARERKGISLDTLVALINNEKTKSTLKRYEDGVSRIEMDVLEMICNKLDLDYLKVIDNAKMNATTLKRLEIVYDDYFPLHYCTNLSCGSFDELLDSEPDSVVYVPIKYQHMKDRLYAFKVNGTSMNNVIEDESIVITESVGHLSSINPGTIVVALLNGEATVKRLFVNEKTVTLMPDSSDKAFQPIMIDLESEKVEIVGRVIWHMNPDNISDRY